MKLFIAGLLALIVLSTINACESSKKLTETGKDVKHALKVKKVPGFVKSEKHRNVTIEDWSIDGNVAKLAITYSGGCGTHTFSAYFDGNFMKSLPPKAGVFLQHETEDNCRKLIIDTLYINLSELRYDANAGSVIVGFNGTEKMNEYSYKKK